MKKIKVILFGEILIENLDGATRTTFQLIKRIPKDCFDFIFICGTGSETIEGFKCIKVPTVKFPLNIAYEIALPTLCSSKLKRTIKEFAPDIIHIVTPSFLGHFAVKYAQQQNIPVVSIYHTHFISYIQYYLKALPFVSNLVKSWVIKSNLLFYNKCKVIYVPSETIEEELSNIGIEKRRMKIWKRGIDKNLFSPSKRVEGVMKKLTGNDAPVILFASRLVWEKNLKTLIKIYYLLEKMHLPFNLMVVGNGPARSACENLMPKAIFTGEVDHYSLATLYASATVFVFPSISETIGNVVLEAMASGLPCVIADGGGSGDLIQQGINGFKCKANREDVYVEKIKLIVENEELRERIQKAGLDYCKLFNWDALVEIYINDLKKLVRPSIVESLC